jgi:hypothetical protein
MTQEINTFTLLSPAPGSCPECAVAHEPHEPHDRESLFYQIKFKMEHGRDPTWTDAISHCPKELKDAWTRELQKKGIAA